MRRITHISPCYVDFDQGTGGVANVVRSLAIHQSELGYDVRILDTDSLLGTTRGTPGTVKHGNLEHTTVRQPKIWQISTWERRFVDLFLQDSDEAIHIHTCFGPFTDAASRALAKQNKTFFFSAHGKLSPGMVDHRGFIKRLWWNWISYPGFGKAMAIPMSSNEIGYFHEAGLTQVSQVVPNGVDPLSEEYLAGLSSPMEDPYVLYFGYLDPRKQPILLARAFAASQVSRTHRLVFAGPDDYGHQAEIEQATRQCDIQDRVVFTGGVYGEDKWRWLRDAKCVCLPSKGEGQPLVILEALTAGTPVICSRLCNVDLGDDCGETLDGFSIGEWAQAIDRIAASDESHLRRNARRLGRSFEWPNVTKQMLACYQQHLDSEALGNEKPSDDPE